MKEVIITKYGPPEVLQVRKLKTPIPKDNQVLEQNYFTGVNFSEIMARMRLYPGAPKPPATLGSEACGIVESVGKDVTRFKPGDKVMLFCKFCSYSTHIISNEEMIMPLPNDFRLEEGAAFPLVYVTAYMMMFDLGNFRKGETILIHGAGGGVGTAAIQLAQAVGGKIIGTASKWKHAKLNEMGIFNCIDYNSEDVLNKVMEYTKGYGVNLIFDPIGGENWKRSYKCLSPMGKLIVYGDQNFVKEKSFSLYASIKEVFSMPKYRPMKLMSDNKSVMGYHLGRLTGAEHKIQNAVQKLTKIVEDNHLKPVIARTFSYSEAPKAHQYIQDRKNFGKVLLDFTN